GGNMDELISLDKVSKSYGKKQVLDKITLTIKGNQSVALIGHNGSGKSTLLKMMAGLVNPSEGNISYSRKLLFHYVPERFPKLNLTVVQYLKRMCEIDGIAWEKEKIESICDDFFLKNMIHTKMKNLSKGTLQKVGVIQALLTKPDVLLLDEPLSGQDMDSQKVFIKKMNELRNDNVTIVMSCHERYLIESISDTVYQIENGKAHQILTMEELEVKKYVLWFEGSSSVKIPEEYKNDFKIEGNMCKAIVQENLCNEMILKMMQQGWNLRRMTDAEDERTGQISSTTVF
ncbi:MAG: ATP-binding cassette domain-containing protein, partial [Roseburia sp.]